MAKRPVVSDETLFEVPPGELDAVLAGLPSEDSKIKLYRMNAQGRPAFIDSFDAISFSEEIIKNTYGGGKFKYVAIVGGGVVRQGVLEIEGNSKDNKRTIKKYVPGKGVIYVTTDEQEEISSLLGMPPVSTVPSNGIDPILLILQELKAMREQQAQPQSKRDFLEELKMYREIFAPQQNQLSPTNDVAKYAVDLIKQGLDLAQSAENGGTPWYIMIADKALPIINKAIEAVTLQSNLQRARVQPVNGPIPISSGEQLPPPQNLTGFDAISDKLRAYLPTFLSAASNNVDPNSLVELTLPNISDQTKPDVIVWLESEAWFNDLLKLHPIIQGQQAWWQDYRDSLLNELKNPQGDSNEIIGG